MCEIQDYSIEQKDIYLNKYSVSTVSLLILNAMSYVMKTGPNMSGKVQ